MSNRNEQPDWISRHLVRSKEKAVLATVMRETDGEPYASLVLTASDHQGNPLIYISDLAEHTKNLWQNERASMLFESTAGLNDPLSGARVSLQGKMTECKDPLLVERFYKRHEQSRKYGNAHNFFLFRMEVERAHLIAGFGRIHWIDAA
ncbi:pyridoxamine 5'-phosphate oxidase family protein, partial [bacterium]|nr:pyridoxamine 5'-phosphate oxidase family protein [bacterium]